MQRFLFLIFVYAAVVPAQAETDPGDIVARLRERGELQQAERLADEHWPRADLSPPARADLAIQLALLHTEQALAAPPGARDAHWAKAEAACAALLEGWPENPRRLLVEIQSALVSLARGEQARRWRDEASARRHLSAAVQQLAHVVESVSKLLIDRRLRGQSPAAADAFSVAELESIEANISYQLARATRRLGLCYPSGSPDRDDALLQAVNRLSPLAERRQADELVWNARIELAASLRELGRVETAEQLISQWRNDQPPAEVLQRMTADAEIVSSQTELALDASIGGDTFAAAMGAAANAFHSGHHADAAEQYERIALASPSHPQASEAHRQAILSLAQLLRTSSPDQRALRADRYERLLREHLARWPEEPSAEEVRIWLAQLLAGRGGWQDAAAVLEPLGADSPALREAAQLLARCYEGQLQQLDRSDQPQRAQLVAAATARLQPIVTGRDNRWPDSWSLLQRETAVALARLHLRSTSEPSPYAERLLTAALRGRSQSTGPDDIAMWQPRARALLVEALARHGRAAEAQTIVAQLADAPINVLWEALAQLDSLLAGGSPSEAERRELGELALSLVRLVEAGRSNLDAAALRRLDAFRAAALSATGDRPAALAQYAALAAGAPDDGNVQERFAAFLAASEAPSDWREALTRWQQVESRSRRGGPRWRRARRARIELLTRLGQRAEAEKLVRLTRLLYPDWDESDRSR